MARILTIPATLVVLVLLAIGFVEARKAYWDREVRTLCEADGGVTVFEPVVLSADEWKRLGGDEHGLPIPFADDDKNKAYPYFREGKESRIREVNPEVARYEMLIKRRADGKVLGKSVHYWRRGGDVPTGLFHDSSYLCPKQTALSQEIFKIAGASK